MRHTLLDRSLDDLRDAVIVFGGEVEATLGRAVDSLLSGDWSMAMRIVNDRADLTSACIEIEKRVLRVIALQHPTAGDLRAVLGAQAVARELDRMAGHIESIASALLRLPDNPEAAVLQPFAALGALVRVQVSDALDAYRSRDVRRARRVWDGDDVVDRQYDRLVRSLIARLPADEGGARATDTHLLSVAHSLERIGDRATNICERVVFIATGERRVRCAS